MIAITVILPAHNPDEDRLARTLAGLRAQSLPHADWETLVVNNASVRFPADGFLREHGPANLRVLHAATLGLTHARRHGFTAAGADAAVLVDDDNVLRPDYLERALVRLAENPRVGTLGGPVFPEFAVPPAEWTREFHGLLAIRDLGPEPILSNGLRPPGATGNTYPLHAPVGAGMVLRRPAWEAWIETLEKAGPAPTDRRGSDLSSAGDNDIVLASLSAGWETAYFPDLRLAHLIPASRLEPDYLARLNHGIQRSWMQVLTLHHANPWPPLSALGARLRSLKAWLRHLPPFRGPAATIRWRGACGHFEGRIFR